MSSELDLKLRHYLLEQDLLASGELDVAQKIASKRGETLARSLQRMELLSPDLLQLHAANALGFPIVDLDKQDVDQQLLWQLGEDFCKKYNLIPLVNNSDSSTVDIALINPANIVVADALQQRLVGQTIRFFIADQLAIDRTLYRFFNVKKEGLVSTESSNTVAQLKQLLAIAVTQSASDIHLEPTGDCARVRMRCDGVLRLWRHIEIGNWQLLIGRIKVLAGMDIADSRSAQDGHFSHSDNGRDIDIRVSVLPTDKGEAVVMRILDRNRHALNFESLGINKSQRQQLLDLLKRPEGMLLVCGPTGSGKSTTLYALVESLRGQDLNIITLEDPVEYPVRWVRQTSIDDAVSMGYAGGVRAALRQDPDVMLIGEMRDTETAKMSLRAAMTGHRVLSTVHANSALASVGRLWDLGLQPGLVSGNVIGVVAQRLLRKLCVNCKTADKNHLDCFGAVGCDSCMQTGYSGRQPILEIWIIDKEFDELLHQSASRGSFEQLARQKGMRTLQQAAMSVLSSGLTSVDEVVRVVGPLPEEGFYEEF